MVRKKMLSAGVAVFSISLLFAAGSFAQPETAGVRLFQSYFFDSPIAETPYAQPALDFSSYEHVNILGIGVNGGYGITDQLEVQGELRFENWSPDHGDSESGISDLWLYGRYKVLENEELQIAAGGVVSVPIGKEELGHSHLNFGGFGALRYALPNNLVITGNLGLLFNEITKYEWDARNFTMKEKTEYESSLRLGGGVIYPFDEQMSIIAELAIESKRDFMMLSGGIDRIVGKGRVRAAVGLGLDDGAPDLKIMGGYLISL